MSRGGWTIFKDGKMVDRSPLQAPALNAARKLKIRFPGSEIVVVSPDGRMKTVEKESGSHEGSLRSE